MRRSGSLRAIAGASLLALVAVGCASTGDVDSARQEAAEARRLAEVAAEDAAAARAAAEAAAKDAREANEKADRIFQQSLRK
jgi:hypothetical protein